MTDLFETETYSLDISEYMRIEPRKLEMVEPPEVLYHVAPRKVRRSIARFGLLPAKPTTDGRYDAALGTLDLASQPRGVYAHPDTHIGECTWGRKDADVWGFSPAGLRVARDPILSWCAVVVLQRVPPQRLFWVGTKKRVAEGRSEEYGALEEMPF